MFSRTCRFAVRHRPPTTRMERILLIQGLFCGTLGFLQFRDQALHFHNLVSKDCRHFLSQSIVICNGGAEVPRSFCCVCFQQLNTQRLLTRTQKRHAGTCLPGLQHNTRASHSHRMGWGRRCSRCSSCGFVRKRPRIGAHPWTHESPCSVMQCAPTALLRVRTSGRVRELCPDISTLYVTLFRLSPEQWSSCAAAWLSSGALHNMLARRARNAEHAGLNFVRGWSCSRE